MSHQKEANPHGSPTYARKIFTRCQEAMRSPETVEDRVFVGEMEDKDTKAHILNYSFQEFRIVLMYLPQKPPAARSHKIHDTHNPMVIFGIYENGEPLLQRGFHQEALPKKSFADFTAICIGTAFKFFELHNDDVKLRQEILKLNPMLEDCWDYLQNKAKGTESTKLPPNHPLLQRGW